MSKKVEKKKVKAKPVKASKKKSSVKKEAPKKAVVKKVKVKEISVVSLKNDPKELQAALDSVKALPDSWFGKEKALLEDLPVVKKRPLTAKEKSELLNLFQESKKLLAKEWKKAKEEEEGEGADELTDTIWASYDSSIGSIFGQKTANDAQALFEKTNDPGPINFLYDTVFSDLT